MRRPRQPAAPGRVQVGDTQPVTSTASRSHSPFVWCWIAGVSLLIVQRPIDAPDLWWHLARGRAVMGGAVAPSRHFLTLDTAAEADWLGGVPFHALWQVGGVHALAAVPWLSALGLGVFLLFRVGRTDCRNWLAVVLPLGLWVIGGGLQPVPELFDLVGMAALWGVQQIRCSSQRRMLAVVAIFALWSNLGPRPMWGLLVLALLSPPETFHPRLLFTALLAGSLNPRGIFVWRDSAILVAPSAFVDLGDAAEPGWYGWWADPDASGPAAAFALLWILSLARTLRTQATMVQLARCAVPLLAAIVCRDNLPACGLWLMLDWLRPWFAPRSNPDSMRGTQRWSLALGAAVFGFALADAAGMGLASRARLGWGIAHSVDPRLLDVAPLLPAQGERIGWSPDSRSAGVAAWLGAARMCDHPQRALLGGRWPLHRDLIDDLLNGRRARYRRDDGTWGGRLHQLSEWNVQLLFVPMEDRRMHEALLATSRQPADLDSPTVPYVSAGDPGNAQLVVDVLRQQGLVEVGPWQPTAGIYDRAGWRYDVPELCGLGPSPYPAIRQARFFRGLEIPMAALRALLPIRESTSDRQLTAEFAACQSALAWQEREASGEASRFRILVLQRLSKFLEPNCSLSLEPETAPDVAKNTSAWRAAVDHYIAGRIREAIDELPSNDAQAEYAAAMLHLELGETGDARRRLEQIPSRQSDGALSIVVTYWLDRIGSFDAPGAGDRPRLEQEPL